MKVLKAKVEWYKDYANHPSFELLVDKIPPEDSLRYEERDGLYYAELDGLVHFLYYKMPGRGFGGIHWPITLKDGTKKTLIGPWSSRAGCANALGFGPCVDVAIIDDERDYERGYTFLARAVTLPLIEEAARLANVHLVKVLDLDSYKEQTCGSEQRHAVIAGSNSEAVQPYCFKVPEGVEWMATPSMDPNKLVKG